MSKDVRTELEDFVNNPENFSTLSEEEVRDLSEKQFVDEDLRNRSKFWNSISTRNLTFSTKSDSASGNSCSRAAVNNRSKESTYWWPLSRKRKFLLSTLYRRGGIERYDVVHQIAHGADEPVTQKDQREENGATIGAKDESESGKNQSSRYPADEFTMNLNELAEQEKIDPLVGEEEVERIVQILCRRRKNNPLLVGDAGVRKTAIAEGLAVRN